MTTSNLSRALRLYGTEEPPAGEHLLKAGPLSALFDGTSLRDIRMHGEEVIRAISFVLRDKDWATLAPIVSDLVIEEKQDHFQISYRATVQRDDSEFVYDVAIKGTLAGKLTFSGRGQTPTGFLTNRTGFVILHPIDGVSGEPATIVHTGGDTVETQFPMEINPLQPMMDLREITHHTPRGQRVTCLMEGDTFEMEDQRNWTDASFKTYVRPLALPWPYLIEPEEVIDQLITITVEGDPATPQQSSDNAISVTVGDVIGTIPPLGLGLQPEDSQNALLYAAKPCDLGISHIVCHYDPRLGHGRETLAKQIEVSVALGAEPWLEAVVQSTDDAGAAAEIAALGESVASLGHPFTTVLVSPAPDMKCTLPGSPWPQAPDAARLYAATRAAFPKARIGGGMFSFFTELNRKRPPVEAIDLVTFTTAAIFHAGDDRSLMETLECLPHIVRTLPAITGGLPYAVGPSAIGMRHNPYGDAPVANPENIRQAVNFNDPRQRGIIGAAWNLGYFSAFAVGGAQALTLGGIVGPFGLLSVPSPFPQPWFEGKGGFYPLWHVMRGMAQLKGRAIRSLSVSVPGAIYGIAVDTDQGIELWICNPSPETIAVNLPEGFTSAAILDADSFVAATEQPNLLDNLKRLPSSDLTLDGYAVVRLIRSSDV